jgi:predicted ATPase
VQALLAPVDSVLIFEQPELHLHPKVQSVLGDFFLAMALMGKQCVVETHSEYLINRVRVRIVQSHADTVLSNVRIYFAAKEGAVTRFRPVKPNEYGAILDWPEGFFDQSELEAALLLKEQLKKRQAALNAGLFREVA